MNLSLHDPQFITAEYPTTLTMTLSYGHSTSLSISPCGHYIASGLVDGTILVVDTWTNNVTCVLREHSMPIVGLKWVYKEEDGDRDHCDGDVVGLLAWSRDWKVSLHGLQRNELKLLKLYWSHVFTGGVWSCCIISRGRLDGDCWIDWKLAVCSSNDGMLIVDGIRDGSGVVTKSFEYDTKESEEGGDDVDYGITLCVQSLFGGKYVISGTSKGWLHIIEVEGVRIMRSEKVCNGNIKGLSVVQKGIKDADVTIPVSRLIVNASDRILRQYDIGNWDSSINDVDNWSFDIEQKYQDVVNRIQWNTVTFSPTGEFVVASTQGGSGVAHDVYVWECSMGTLVQILEGAHEELYDVSWGLRSTNGCVCCVAANGVDTGTLYMWGVRSREKWSALAPDFEEIEQNIEYVEMEDEFDQVEEEGELDAEREIVYHVDVVTKEDTDARGMKVITGCVIDTIIE